MLSLSPKLQFQQLEAAKTFRPMSHSTEFQAALSYALAEYAQAIKPNTDQLAGARAYIDTLLNLCEKQEHKPPMRFTALDHIEPQTKTQ